MRGTKWFLKLLLYLASRFQNGHSLGGGHLGFQACDIFLHLGIAGDQGKEESILNVPFPFSFLASVILQIEFLCR